MISRLSSHNIHQLIVGQLNDEPVTFTNKQDALTTFEAGYLIQDWWRLLVDGYLYAKDASSNADPYGWRLYELREKGSVSAFYAAWKFCLNKLSSNSTRQPLELNFIYKLAALVTDEVELLPNQKSGLKGIRPGIMTFTLGTPFHSMTKKGLKSLLESLSSFHTDILYSETDDIFSSDSYAFVEYSKQEKLTYLRNVCTPAQSSKKTILEESLLACLRKQYNNKPGYYNVTFDGEQVDRSQPLVSITSKLKTDSLKSLAGRLYQKMQNNERIVYIAPQNFLIEFLLQKVISNYNEQIVLLSSAQEKLTLIGKTIEAFERIHPFVDANGRIFVNLLMNYLLIEEGFPPATLFQPNVYDAFGYHAEVISAGIRNTLAIYQGERNLFGFNSDSCLTSQKRMDTMLQQVCVRNFSTFLDEILDNIKRIKAPVGTLFPLPNFNSTKLLENLADVALIKACNNFTSHSLLPRVIQQIEKLRTRMCDDEEVKKACENFLAACHTQEKFNFRK